MVTGVPLASGKAHGPVAALGSQSVLLVGSYCVISFLRGQLINHDTQPAPAENQSNPIAPGVFRLSGAQADSTFYTAPRQGERETARF
jgi:hypothetical protein